MTLVFEIVYLLKINHLQNSVYLEYILASHTKKEFGIRIVQNPKLIFFNKKFVRFEIII